MEFLAQFNVFAIIIVTTIAFLFSVLKKLRNGTTNSVKLPPGPWKLPLIGNIHQLFGGLPHHILRDMAKKHGPLMQLQLGEIPLVIVSSPEIAKEVLKTHDPVFAGRPQILAFKVIFYNCNDIICRTYDDYWRQMRKICVHELLNAKNVRSWAPVRHDEGVRLIASIRNSIGESINLTEKISDYSMSVVFRASFGNRRVFQGQDEFIKLLTQISSLASGFDLADLFPSVKFVNFVSGLMPKLLKIHKKIDNLLEDILNEHTHNFASTQKFNGQDGEEDFIDSLLRVSETNNLQFPITDINIKAVILDVFAAGTDTSTTTTIWAMSELMRNPQVMAKAQSEIKKAFIEKEYIDEEGINELKYLDFVIKETLRLHPPLPLLVPRECLEDCVINGYNIPSKTKLMVNAWAIGRDPSLWPDPESFTPERFENNMTDFMGNSFELIPFGAGRRMCPGIALGLANVKLPLALLLHHFDWDLPEVVKSEGLDMTEYFGASCGRKSDLCLIPILKSCIADQL